MAPYSKMKDCEASVRLGTELQSENMLGKYVCSSKTKMGCKCVYKGRRSPKCKSVKQVCVEGTELQSEEVWSKCVCVEGTELQSDKKCEASVLSA